MSVARDITGWYPRFVGEAVEGMHMTAHEVVNRLRLELERVNGDCGGALDCAPEDVPVVVLFRISRAVGIEAHSLFSAITAAA